MLRRLKYQKGLTNVQIVAIVLGTVFGVLIIFLIIFGMLASMLIPSALAVRERARRAECMSNLREIGRALVMYSVDFDGYYPTIRARYSFDTRPMASLALLFDKYVDNPKVFVCPSTTDNCSDLRPGQTLQPHGARASPGDQRQCSYAYDDTRDEGTSRDIVIAGDAPPAAISGSFGASKNSDNHFGDGQCVLFCGGNLVLWITMTKNPMNDVDDVYTAAVPINPGASDSCIRQ